MNKPKEKTRPLTDAEQGAINLVKTFESAADRKANMITLTASRPALEAMAKAEAANLFRVSKVKPDPQKAGSFIVYMTMTQFHSYMMFCLANVGLTLMLDNSIRTKDGLTVTNEYLQ